MDDVTRRSFVRTSAGAAAGVTATGVFGVAEAEAKHKAPHHHPVVAWIGDPRDGKITIMKGDREVTIRDHKLAARIANAAR
jgi:hypothetical protein